MSSSPSTSRRFSRLSRSRRIHPNGSNTLLPSNSTETISSYNFPKASDDASYWEHIRIYFYGRYPYWKEKIENLCESTQWDILMIFCTMWALYQGDIRLAATNKSADMVFLVFASMVFFLFAIEIPLVSIYREGYFFLCDFSIPYNHDTNFLWTWCQRLQIGSFYFWLDVISTATLVFDLNWILGDAYNAINGSSGGAEALAGARAGRLVRLVRLVRLFRFEKLWKSLQLTYYEIVEGEVPEELLENSEDSSKESSRIAQSITETTNRRVLSLILIMLICVPLLDVFDDDTSLAIAAKTLHGMAMLADGIGWNEYGGGYQLTLDMITNRFDVIYLSLNDNIQIENSFKLNQLRRIEKVIFEQKDSLTNFTTKIIFDRQLQSQRRAIWSMIFTSFTIGILVCSIFYFLYDIERMALRPIEKLVNLVQKISENPLGVQFKMLGEEDGFYPGMETTTLLATINKIGELMRVGFGNAGASIIARNLSESGGSSDTMNIMGSGKTIQSIFGFCDVRQFTDTTECLQEEVMLFVNRIAHILHSIVVQCSGAANKNIGDAFLLTWKIEEGSTLQSVAQLADQALLTFVKSLIELSRYQKFVCNFSDRAMTRLLARFPDYLVKIGCGLHVGWAVEGAIGSNRKLDATYLSPHVNQTEFLESSTKQYGVPLLVSEQFFNLLSPQAASCCRCIDRIRRTPEEEPFYLFTYDFDNDINWGDYKRNRFRSPKDRLDDAVKHSSNYIPTGFHPLTSSNNQLPRMSLGNLGMTSVQTAATNSLDDSSGSVAPSRRPMQRFGSTASNMGRRTSTLLNAVNMITRPITPQRFGIINEDASDDEDLEATDSHADSEAQRVWQESLLVAPEIILPPYTMEVWFDDQDLVDSRQCFPEVLKPQWCDALEAYLTGDWKKAQELLRSIARVTNGKDGPTQYLLTIVRNQLPESWNGFYDLSEEYDFDL